MTQIDKGPYHALRANISIRMFNSLSNSLYQHLVMELSDKTEDVIYNQLYWPLWMQLDEEL